MKGRRRTGNAATRRARKHRDALRRRRRRRRGRSALGALTTGALALPGLVGSSAADTPVDRAAVSYGFSHYVEDELDSSKVTAGGETSRYEVQMHQFRVETPLADRIDLEIDLVHETMSGASPWYVIPDVDGNPIQVMSGATIEDQRTDALLTGTYYFDSGSTSLAGGLSVENDYLSVNGAWSGKTHFNEKNTTLSTGVGVSIDQIEPTDSDLFPLRVEKESKNSFSVFAGIAQVIGERSAVQSTVTYQHSRGFLADPYKQVLVEGEPIADARPDSRNQVAWLNQFRHHVSAVDGTLHADYRFFLDDWQVTSHTLELAWYQSLWSAIRLIPAFRYYTQSQAEFYRPYFTETRSDGHYSSDYRLSPYGAISWRLKAETTFDTWRIGWRAAFSWERYLSSEDFALQKVSVGNPGLVSFNVFSISLTGAF